MCEDENRQEVEEYLEPLHWWRSHSSISPSTSSGERQGDKETCFQPIWTKETVSVRHSFGTHTATANKDDAETLQHTGGSHHPGQPQEQDHAEDVLQARQVDPHERPHLWRLEGAESQPAVGSILI